METVIALVLFLSILTGCAGETLTNVKNSSITPNAAQTEEAVRYTVETETCADTIQAEDGTELLAYQFEVPELEVCRADGEIVNEAETDQEEQALTAAETFNARFADWLDGSSLDVFQGGGADLVPVYAGAAVRGLSKRSHGQRFRDVLLQYRRCPSQYCCALLEL